jgi:hypothetical protein
MVFFPYLKQARFVDMVHSILAIFKQQNYQKATRAVWEVIVCDESCSNNVVPDGIQSRDADSNEVDRDSEVYRDTLVTTSGINPPNYRL